jgi:predicted DsbA family dithiol-disulfide isomerase
VHDALFQAAPRLEDVLATTKPCAAAAKDVDADLAEAMTFGVRSTPSFLIGRIQPDGLVKLTQRISGAARFAEFAQAVDGVLAAQEPR